MSISLWSSLSTHMTYFATAKPSINCSSFSLLLPIELELFMSLKRILPLLDQLYECKHISIPLENLIIPTQLILSPNCTCKRYKTYCFNECSKRILHNSYIGNYKNKPYPLLNLQITFVKQYAKTVGVIRCILI